MTMLPRGPRIEHVALWVRDFDAVCASYAEHFGAEMSLPLDPATQRARRRP